MRKDVGVGVQRHIVGLVLDRAQYIAFPHTWVP